MRKSKILRTLSRLINLLNTLPLSRRKKRLQIKRMFLQYQRVWFTSKNQTVVVQVKPKFTLWMKMNKTKRLKSSQKRKSLHRALLRRKAKKIK